MKTTIRTMMALGLTFVVATSSVAQEQAPVKSANARKNAKLMAELHRTTATLIVERNADKPDQAKIDALNGKVLELRQQLGQAANPAGVPRGQGNFGVCTNPGGPVGLGPQAGQRMGRGPQAGRGMGRGSGQGVCPYGNVPGTNMQGQGRGPQGWGAGMSPGTGRGPQMGRGPGPGRGQGYAYGGGMGRGRGRGSRR